MRPIYAIDLWTFGAVYFYAEGYPWWWGTGALTIAVIMLLIARPPSKDPTRRS